MSGRILVVDDLPANVKLLEVKLTNQYYEVLTAENGKSALAMAEERKPDIILLDVMMPEMDGFEVCRRLKSQSSTAHIPVVMVTALSSVKDRVTGLEAGADDFLTKPINDLSLFARIRSLLRLKQITDEFRLRNLTGSEFEDDSGNLSSEISIANASIVLVDDDVVQARNIVDKLSAAGHKVILYTEPKESMERVNSSDIDLIIVSTQLLDMDGLRICSHFRNQQATAQIPLLMLIEEDDTDTIVKGLDIGTNDYLITPIDANELMARVKTQIRRKRYQSALRSTLQESVTLAIKDGLTNLYNRRYFDVHLRNMLDKMKQDQKPLSLMMIDIDHFKNINDTYGHLVGDEILKQVPQAMISNIRATDLLARYGGEEFVIVMPGTATPPSQDVAQRICNMVAKQEFQISGGEGKLKCTISIGVAAASPFDTPEDLIKRADSALYKAKESGRNRVVVGS